MARHRLLWGLAIGALLIHVLIVGPAVTVLLIERQAADERERRHDLCVQAQQQRVTLLDLIDFASVPSDADPALVSNVEASTAIRIEDARRASFRAYAHNHLEPINC